MTQLDVSNLQDKVPVTQKILRLLQKVVAQTMEHEGISRPLQLSLVLVDNATIQELNSKYRGIDAPTDVLSFALLDEERETIPCLGEEPEVLGEIIISLEKAREQAREYGHSLEREVCFLTVHGLLHLLGYDHETEEERKLMNHKEEEILSTVGLSR
ncbi:rRNA maturation RNase YbeY [Calderihabitans maritimus]|uniref:Endoribonuclease YbeY n=1 Tax=Calderihabitans maritimus TaxID=1246530 RepID=A0A1Z5HV75_9FIRM|nr:rRNA maturation RNase YbeY [Calderihabitans maritimus]GAW93439.1 metalloprotease ybeY [Calderihabitans maritimus]